MDQGGHRLDNCKEDSVSKRDATIFPTKHEFSVQGYKQHLCREEELATKENLEVPLQQKQEVSACKLEFWNGNDDFALKTARLRSSSHRKGMESVDGGEHSVPRIDNQDVVPLRKPDLNPSYAAPQSKNRNEDTFAADNYSQQYSVQNLTRKIHEEDDPKWKPHFNSGLPPPYVKPNINPKDSKHGAKVGSSVVGLDCNGASADPSTQEKAYAIRTEKYQEGFYHPDKEGQKIPPTRVNSHDSEKDYYYNRDGSDAPIPRRRSSRRRHLNSASCHIEVNNVEDTEFVRRKPRSRRKDDSRRGLQILFDDEWHKNDEEERIIEKLLMHYSKKPSSSEEGKIRRKSKSHHAHNMGSDASEARRKASRDSSDDMPETISQPARSISLPHEQTAQSERTKKVYARATSFQQEGSNADRHVHPKLPDYDDLAAHFAAMKGR